MRNATAVLIALLTAASGPARIITVDDDSPAEFNNIQAAINDANDGDIVVVADGSYRGDGNRDIDFKGKAITVRSQNGPDKSIIDCQWLGRGFYFHGGEDENAILDGFTIINGSADLPYFSYSTGGGGIRCEWSSPTIKNNIIRQNSGYAGGGISCLHSRATIMNNTIEQNNFPNAGAGLFAYASELFVVNNKITGNRAETFGGGMVLWYCSARLINNIIAGNLVTDGNGGGIHCRNSSIIIINNTITGNLCSGTGWGEVSGGGGMMVVASSATISNSIIWYNFALAGGDEIVMGEDDWTQIATPGEFWGITFEIGPASVTAQYNDIKGGWLGEGNIDADPCFVKPGSLDFYVWPIWVDGDHHLLSSSPCIDTGDGSAVPSLVTTDLDGKPRIANGTVDRGAYEYARQPPGIIYVDTRPTGANNGFSWKDAFNHLQDGLAAASAGGEIRVAQGTYKPDKGGGITPGDRAASFHLTNGTIVKGGYAGFNAPDPDARDIRNYETILSGDIGTVADFSDNSYHIVQGGDNAILEGFTVFAGNANGLFQGGYGIGGGLYNDNCRLVVANCTFEENAAFNGGAIFSAGGTLAVYESVFVANLASQGGALVNLNGQMTLTRCVLRNNAEGTIFCFGNGALKVESCVFDNNYGGWHAIDRSGTGSVIEVINSLFTHNAGGAINSGYNSLLIVNSTLVDNHTTTFGGAVCCSYGSLTAVNCIMWGNTAGWGGDEIFGADAAITVSYSCIAGGYPGTGNINMNPLFRAPASEDYHLLAGSPCINAGDNSAVPPVIKTDLDGRPRVIGGRIDMGAYEMLPWVKVPMKFTPQALNCKGKGKWVKAHFVLPAEFTVEDVDSNSPAKAQPPGVESEYMNVFVNDDGVVEIEAAFERAAFCDAVKSCGPIEITVTGSLTNGQYFYGTDTIKIIKNSFECLAFLSSHWLELNCSKPDCCDGFDADRDTTVNLKDFAIMALRWMESN